MKRIDDAEEERFLKVCAYGRSGTGKTTLGVTAPRPLILASERQAIVSIKQAAKMMGIPVPAVLLMESTDDYRMVIKALRRSKCDPFRIIDNDGNVVLETEEWPETVVLDSLTDAAHMIGMEVSKISPPKPGKDNLPAVSMRWWGTVADKVVNLVKSFQAAPINVLFLCLVNDKETGDDDERVRTVIPQLPTKKLADSVCAVCNLVGYTYRSEARVDGKVKVAHGTMFVGPEPFMLKRAAPLRDREKSNFSMWHKAIFDHIEPEGEVPMPSLESAHSEPEPEQKNETQPEGEPAETNAPAQQRARQSTKNKTKTETKETKTNA